MGKLKTNIFKVINLCLLTSIILVLVIFSNGLFELGIISKKINQFTSRAEFIETTSIQNQKINIYKVKPKYEFEINDRRKVFNYHENLYLGSSCDITITSRNPLRKSFSNPFKDIFGFASKFMYIGHASMNINEELIIESVGNLEEKGVRIKENTWIQEELSKSVEPLEIIGLRLKNLSDTKREKIINSIVKYENEKYSFLSINGYNCTSLITKTLKKENIKIDYDYFLSTGNDFIISEYLFLTFIFERKNTGIYNIYYLGE